MRRPIGRHASSGGGIEFACVALVMAAATLVYGQGGSAAGIGEATNSPQPVKRDYRFEVASIRPGGPPTGQEYKAGKQGYTPGRFRETNMMFSAMGWEALDVKQSYQFEYPHWMDSTFFTINATLPDGATKADLPIMFQHLLEDRFGLMFHHETRQMSGYELVMAKSGPKLTKSAGPAPDKAADNSLSAAIPFGSGIEFKDGAAVFTKDARSAKVCGGPSATCWLHGHDKSMKALASDLANEFDVPVMNATGLEGGYDYTLTFTAVPKSSRGIVLRPLPAGAGPWPAAGEDGAPAPLEHPFLRDALREQLGLELTAVKNVPVDVVVVDSANKLPTEN
jgi:uncharacterized protein (TIGR03435 family)